MLPCVLRLEVAELVHKKNQRKFFARRDERAHFGKTMSSLLSTPPSAVSAGEKSQSTFKACEIIAAPYAPFKADGSVNLGAIAPYAESLLNQGVSGVFICGTTGEGASLTTPERKEVAETWMKASGSRLDVIVHTGHNSLDEAVDLGRHAESIGADGISALAPSFFKPANDDQLIACCVKMAAAAPSLPFYYYHLPSMTGTDFPVSRWMSQAAREIPNFRGVKFTYENLADFQQCMELEGGRFKCYFGRDELFLDGLKIGAKAAVGSTYNYAARLYLSIDRAYADSNLAEAERLQKIACSFIDVMIGFGFFGAAKALMQYAGVDCGAPRLPLAPLPKEKTSALLSALEATGVLEFVPKG